MTWYWGVRRMDLREREVESAGAEVDAVSAASGPDVSELTANTVREAADDPPPTPPGDTLAEPTQSLRLAMTLTSETDMSEPATQEPQLHSVSLEAPPPSSSPPPGRRANRGERARGPRRLIVSVLIGALLLLVVALPVLHGLAPSGTPSVIATRVPTVVASATTTPNGTPNPNAFSWVGTLRSYAQQQYINNLISHMTLDEEIGQMIQVSFYGTSTPDQWVLDEIAQDHIGSVILYDSNLTSKQVAQSWTSKLQASAKIPLLLGADVEGGTVNRLLAIDGYIPSADEMAGHSNAAAYSQQVGQQISNDLTTLGLNNDYAPVVDVDSGVGAAGGQLGGRMFGSTPNQVSKLAGAFLTGLQQSGKVVGTLKHFPGLGDVPVDPHLKLYTITRGLNQLESIDWAPYKTLIASGQVDMIMSTHVVVQAVDPTRPASLSKPVITGILRDQFHYNGVIITDAIYMDALNSYSVADRILYAVEAGNDIISAAYDPGVAQLALGTIRSAVQNGTITKQRIDDSVRRILALKLKYGLLSMPKP